jgi:DNA-binding HxlR family transcriptional regulator
MQLDDYVLVLAAGVIVATAVILATLLSRYRGVVREAEKSTTLAKDVWDSANARFSVVDARIIDLMAKTEVMSARMAASQQSSQSRGAQFPSHDVRDVTPTKIGKPLEPVPRSSTDIMLGEGTETEVRVLRLLADGPRSSAEIKDAVGRSREHTARMMKGLYDRGLVVRNARNKPYVYEITPSGRSYIVT